MLSITIRQIEYALAVARTGGVTAAASALNVSQPALSVAIAQLEAHLGRPLFLRRPGAPVVPTAHGQQFLDAAERVLGDLARLTRGETPALPARLGCFEDLAPMILAPLMARAAGDRPGLTVLPVVSGFEALADMLSRGRTDLAISYDLGFDDRFQREEITRLTPHAVLADSHPLAARPHLTLEQLAGEALILADQGLSVIHMQALFTRAGLTPRIAYRAPSLELMRSFAANGLGIGISYTCPAPAVSYDGRSLVTRPLVGTGPGEPIVLVRLQGATLPPAAAALRLLVLQMQARRS